MLGFEAGNGAIFLEEERMDAAGELFSMTLGDRDGMTTAMPSAGVIAFWRLLGRAGVVLMRGRVLSGLAGVPVGLALFSFDVS